MATHASLILHNARVLTMDPARPKAQAVAVGGDRILAVGRNDELLALRNSGSQVIDCCGLTLLPGLVDAHCHLLATASALSALDFGPAVVASLSQLQAALTRRAAEVPAGRWLRGIGLDPAGLAEGRFPTRRELDAAAPDHPVRLDHGSGHGAVLNSLALRLAGIDAGTPDPPEGVIVRDEADGEPTGLLLELSGFLRRRLGHTRELEDLEEDVGRLSQKLLSYGVTSVQDAGPENGPSQWQTFRSLSETGKFLPRITAMTGAANAAEMRALGLGFGAGDHRLRLGHAKIMLTLTTGALHPEARELRERVSECRDLGFPVAIHAIEEAAVAAATQCLREFPGIAGVEATGGIAGNRRTNLVRSRIEHCAECPPSLLEQVRQSGAMVVTQPGFLYWRGDRYLERMAAKALPHLYPVAALACAGIPLAFSSDSPVIDPSPWASLYGALAGRTASGQPWPPTQEGGITQGPLTLAAALRAYTAGGAVSEGTGAVKGAIRAGMLADMALVSLPPPDAEPERLKDTQARMTVLGGRVVWGDGVGE